jgi:twitching motility two-component system response regulator PilH
MLTRKKILLVDDTLTVTAFEKLILGDGYQYLEARNGEEAFQRALELQPDLILMDLNMPVKNGMEGLGSLKAEPRTAHIPVVMITTRGENDAMEACRRLGCAEFLTKPIDRDLLRSTVRTLLEGGS